MITKVLVRYSAFVLIRSKLMTLGDRMKLIRFSYNVTELSLITS